jgi:hypothetical protein
MGAPAMIIGPIIDAIYAWQTTRGAETATHVNGFVTRHLLLCRARWCRVHRSDRRLPRERLILTQPGH